MTSQNDRYCWHHTWPCTRWVMLTYTPSYFFVFTWLSTQSGSKLGWCNRREYYYPKYLEIVIVTQPHCSSPFRIMNYERISDRTTLHQFQWCTRNRSLFRDLMRHWRKRVCSRSYYHGLVVVQSPKAAEGLGGENGRPKCVAGGRGMFLHAFNGREPNPHQRSQGLYLYPSDGVHGAGARAAPSELHQPGRTTCHPPRGGLHALPRARRVDHQPQPLPPWLPTADCRTVDTNHWAGCGCPRGQAWGK